MKRTLQPYVQGLDGLRGIAISLVLVHHIALFGKWRVGPDIFFVLSGYLTTRSLRDHAGDFDCRRLLAFHKRRVMRLWPPLLVVLACLCPWLILSHGTDEDLRRDLVAALSFTVNWQQVLWNRDSSTLVHLWSLAAEQQFYLLWPPVLLCCPKRWTAHLLAALACVAVIWRGWLWSHGAGFNRLYFGLDTHADALIVGCLIAVLPIPPWLQQAAKRAGPGCLGALILAAMTLPAVTTSALCVSMTVTTILAALIVLSLQSGGRLCQVLAFPPLQATGRWSYSLYLWNFPIIALFNPHWAHGVKAAQLTMIFAMSSATYVLVEKPLTDHLKARRQRLPNGVRPAEADVVQASTASWALSIRSLWTASGFSEAYRLPPRRLS